MGRRRDKQLGSRRRQVLQLEDSDGRDSYLAQYGYNSRYGEEDEDDMADNMPMFGGAPHLGEENMDCDSDERPQDTDDIPLPDGDMKTNGGGHPALPKEGKKIDSELANFMAEIEAISTVPLPEEIPVEPPATDAANTNAESKEDPPVKPKDVKPTSTVVRLEAPVSCWQQCLDENTECYYYWNTQTNEVTWDVPAEYTQYLLLMKSFEEKVVRLQQAGKQVKVCGPGEAGDGGADPSEEQATAEYGPFLPETQAANSDKADDDGGNWRRNKGSDSVGLATGKLLSADYYSSGEGSDDDGGGAKPDKPVSDPDDDMDFDIDDIDRELELALERKQNESKAPSKTVETAKHVAEVKAPSPVQAPVEPMVPAEQVPPVTEQIRCEDIPFPPSETDKAAERSPSPANDTQSNHSADSKISKADPIAQKENSEFAADTAEKDKNFRKLLEVKDDRPGVERKEKRIEERKSSKDDKKSSKEERKGERKGDRKDDRKEEKKLEHREKKKKDDRKEEKKSHRHKHRKEEGSGRSRHASDHKRPLSVERDDTESDRSHRKRSKHKHRDKDRDKPVSSVVSAVQDEAELDKEETPEKADDLTVEPAEAPKLPVESTEPEQEKSLKETIEETSETVLGKLQFLEIVKEGLTGLQVLLISLETRIADWEAGGLTGEYLLGRLQEAGEQLLKYEEGAAPPGWSTHWDRTYRRYFYTNAVSGESQWDYPDPDMEASSTKDTSSTPAPPTSDGLNAGADQKQTREDKVESGDNGVAELGPLVHPGEPPPPGTAEAEEETGTVDGEAYEMSPAHSVEMEDVTDLGVNSEDMPSGNPDSSVIARPPQLLGSDTANQPAAVISDTPPEDKTMTDDPPVVQTAPIPAADGDKLTSDSHHSHHKEKKKKKDKSISSSSLSLKKKKVSSLVQKWQQVQQEVEREEKSSKERESYLHRYSP